MKKNKKQGNDKIGIWLGSAFAALLAAIAVFAAMVGAEKKVLTGYEKGQIYLAVCTIPKGQCITPDNYEQYMRIAEMDKSCIPKTAITSLEQITEMVPVQDIDEGVLLTTGMFQTVDEILADMRDPVIIGFRAEDLFQVAGGVLRSGDRIHIYCFSEEYGNEMCWKDVFV
nr:hypothetical protein [Acetatifactor sp.]